MANPDQANVDADGVGDVCEIYGAAEDFTTDNVRMYFDAFAPADPRWLATAAPWTQDTDFVLTPAPGPANALPTVYRSPDFTASGATWLIEMGVEVATQTTTLRIVLDASGSGDIRECALDCARTESTTVASHVRRRRGRTSMPMESTTHVTPACADRPSTRTAMT